MPPGEVSTIGCSHAAKLGLAALARRQTLPFRVDTGVGVEAAHQFAAVTPLRVRFADATESTIRSPTPSVAQNASPDRRRKHDHAHRTANADRQYALPARSLRPPRLGADVLSSMRDEVRDRDRRRCGTRITYMSGCRRSTRNSNKLSPLQWSRPSTSDSHGPRSQLQRDVQSHEVIVGNRLVSHTASMACFGADRVRLAWLTRTKRPQAAVAHRLQELRSAKRQHSSVCHPELRNAREVVRGGPAQMLAQMSHALESSSEAEGVVASPRRCCGCHQSKPSRLAEQAMVGRSERMQRCSTSPPRSSIRCRGCWLRSLISTIDVDVPLVPASPVRTRRTCHTDYHDRDRRLSARASGQGIHQGAHIARYGRVGKY